MENHAPQKEFIPWPDLIRVVATVLVVMIHVSGQITNIWGQVPNSDWFIANIYGGFARICVALFFMISGYLLLPRSESLTTFYRKRLPKVVIPWVAWSLIYLGWFCGNHHGTCTPPVIQDLLLVQGTYYHLWFLRSLIGIYLILPVLRLMIHPDADKKILWYWFGLWLIFQPGLAIAKRFWGFETSLSAPLTIGFIGFFILGYLLGSWNLSRLTAILSTVAWFVASLVTVIGTYILTRPSGKFDGFFYDLISLNVTVASAAAFLLLREVSESRVFASAKVHGFIRWLASGTFGIYLVHILVIEILHGWIPGIHLDSFMGNPIWSIPLTTGVVFLVSFLTVRLLQKIPVLEHVVPG